MGPPDWWISKRLTNEAGQPHLYFYAKGERSTEQGAREQAVSSIRRQIADYILSRYQLELLGGEKQASSPPQIDVTRVEISGEKALKSLGKWTVYMCGRYPRSEYERVVGMLELGRTLGRRYRSGKSLYHQGAYKDAIRILESEIAQHGETPFVEHDIEASKILLGDSWLACNSPLSAAKARQYYQDVLNTSLSSSWKRTARERYAKLPDPPRLWNVRNKFGGKSVGLLCLRDEGQGWGPYSSLAMILEQDCRDVLLTEVNLAGLVSAADSAVVYSGSVHPLIRAGRQRRTDLVLAVLVSTDPDKRGQHAVAYGVTREAIDTTVRFFVVRVSDGRSVYTGEFKGVAGQGQTGRLSQYVANILVRNYLDKECPAVFDSVP